MKFVCDKCKTRYSIGEDRVRGKILKIRCKNCQHVITVREGMDADGGAPTTGTPTSATPPPRPPVRPPAELDAEWYVSIDGAQTGPMTLPEAQQWVASKSFEADLHCWSEGFDDWLSVDKVSHFRNLRKPRVAERAKTAAPPPTPAKREEPKPLFAATMAAIEKDASASQPLPPVTAIPAIAKQSAPVIPVPRLNGAGSSPVPAMPAMPQATKGKGTGPTPSVPNTPATPTRRSTPSGRFDAQKSASHAALAAAFDDPDDSSDSATQLGAPAFPDERPAPAPAPAPAKNMFDFGAATGSVPAIAPAPKDPFASYTPKADAAPAPAPARTVRQALESDDDDDGLSIGEVSRVVKLADLMPKPKPERAATSTGQTGSVQRISQPIAQRSNQTGSVQRINATGSVPRMSPSELGMNVNPALASAGPAADESVVARSFAQRHRRGMMALVAFSVLLVAGVVGVLMYVTSQQTDEVGGGLGGGTTRTIDTSRPEDIVRRQLPPTPDTGSGSAVTQKPKYVPRPNTGTQTPVDEPKGDSLRASEIEDMAAKQGEGTKRCYMRAQKGALGFEIADLKKIAVTLTVGKDGGVADVQLSSHAADTFGQCLIARIKAWKFRESPSGGTFRISLAFSNG